MTTLYRRKDYFVPRTAREAFGQPYAIETSRERDLGVGLIWWVVAGWIGGWALYAVIRLAML